MAPITHISAKKTPTDYWKELWNYRELFFFLAWRDFLIRYKQTVVGVLWAVLRPIIMLAILTVVFGKIGHFQNADSKIPYILVIACGMLPWQLFASILGDSSQSLLNNAHLITKIYFPRLILPSSAVIISLADTLIATVLILPLFFWYRTPITGPIWLLPVFLAMLLCTAFGFGLWVTALTVRFRDLRFLVPYVVQVGMFVTPIGYTAASITKWWGSLLYLNPLTGAIEGIRWACFGAAYMPTPTALLTSTIASLFLIVSGIWYFRSMERTFADVI